MIMWIKRTSKTESVCKSYDHLNKTNSQTTAHSLKTSHQTLCSVFFVTLSFSYVHFKYFYNLDYWISDSHDVVVESHDVAKARFSMDSKLAPQCGIYSPWHGRWLMKNLNLGSEPLFKGI